MRAIVACLNRACVFAVLLLLVTRTAAADTCEITVDPPDEHQLIHYALLSDCPGHLSTWATLSVDGREVFDGEMGGIDSEYVGCYDEGSHTFTAKLRTTNGFGCGCLLSKTIPFTVEHRSDGMVTGFTVEDGVATIFVDGTYAPPAGYSLHRLDAAGVDTVVSSGAFSSTKTIPADGDGIFYVNFQNVCTGEIGQAMAVSSNFDLACDAAGGQCCSGTCFGNPIKSTSGNMRYVDVDPLPGLPVKRVYDSQRADGSTRFGAHWYSMFDAHIIHSGTDRVVVTTEQAQIYSFRNVNGGFQLEWPRAGGVPAATLTAENAGWTLREPNARTVRYYDAFGLRKIRSLDDDRTLTVSYDEDGNPAGVTDSWEAWSYNVAADSSGHITAITAVDHPELGWQYAYDGNDLASVRSMADVPWRTYTYGPLLTAVHDSLGNLIESHTFDGDKAVSDTSSGAEISSVTYDHPGRVPGEEYTETTTAAGAVTRYYSRLIDGMRRVVELAGSCDCGGEDIVYARGPRGEVLREQDARGYITEHTYGPDATVRLSTHTSLRPGNCDPATDASHCRLTPDTLAATTLVSTTASTMTHFEYDDGLWPEKPTEIRSPSVVVSGSERIEQLTYDERGNVLVRSVSGYVAPGQQETHTTTNSYYTFDNGPATPRFLPPLFVENSQWAELNQPIGLLAAVDGPRTDVDDVTEYVYYPNAVPNEFLQISPPIPGTWRGRLAAVRNAAGQVTTYENYDLWGNAQKVTDPNGVVTEFTFDTLGRMLTKTVKGIARCDTAADPLCGTDVTTTMTYAATLGPLQTTERPDGSVDVYAYDDRGRVSTLSRGPAAADLRERREDTYDPASGKKALERLLGFENGGWAEKSRESFVYNQIGQLQETIHADSSSIHYAYKPGGLLASVQDERHAAPNTTYAYDPAGRLQGVSQTLGHRASPPRTRMTSKAISPLSPIPTGTKQFIDTTISAACCSRRAR